ncbi:MAG: phage head closure protein [Planctomycetes bacterium]|nr:phage head closure protein [Planctomycetota bacterium]
MRCCDLTSGKLRHSITFERAVDTPDAGGGSGAPTWTTIATTRAMIEPVSGRERQWSGRLEADVSHKVFIRYRAGLLPSDRINFGGRVMQIRALLNLEETNRWFEIQADEGPAT